MAGIAIESGCRYRLEVTTDEPDLVIAGYARLFGGNIDSQVLSVLRQIGESADEQMGRHLLLRTQ